jgi:hypothetical protein
MVAMSRLFPDPKISVIPDLIRDPGIAGQARKNSAKFLLRVNTPKRA